MSNSPPCTELRTLLIQRRWPEAEALMEKKDAHEFASTPYNNEYPLLSACERRAPASLILSILRGHPDAASKPGKHGYYPLHHACQLRLGPTVIFELIKAYPDALEKVNNMQATPRFYRQHDAESSGYLHKSVLCWKKELSYAASVVAKQERLALLREKKWQLRNELNDIKDRIAPLKECIDDVEKSSLQVHTFINNYLSTKHVLESTEKRTYILILMVKSKIAEMESVLQEELPDQDRRKDSEFQRQYAEEVVDRLKALESDLQQIQEYTDEVDDIVSCPFFQDTYTYIKT